MNHFKSQALLPVIIFSSFQVLAEVSSVSPDQQVRKNHAQLTGFEKRLNYEGQAESNPFFMTPHKMNYILPISVAEGISNEPYEGTSFDKNLKDVEAKFQLSIKVPIGGRGVFSEEDRFYFGFTAKSWWQAYTSEISKPFRETNYQPEIFYMTPSAFEIPSIGASVGLGLGIVHESNGQSSTLSRSWNRIMGGAYLSYEDYGFTFEPWYRIPEKSKSSPNDPSGDDNPDIEEYLGNFQVRAVKKYNGVNFTFLGRQNFTTHKGYMELGLTFPLSGQVRGYIQYTNGYGESLIDYNHSQQRFSVGFALSDLL